MARPTRTSKSRPHSASSSRAAAKSGGPSSRRPARAPSSATPSAGAKGAEAKKKPAPKKLAPAPVLTGKQRRHLRALGHHLEPLVRLGKQGVSEGVIAALEAALEAHELVKVKVSAEAPEGRHEVAELLGQETRAAVAQILGGTILLYRRHPSLPKISLPYEKPSASKAGAAAPSGDATEAAGGDDEGEGTDGEDEDEDERASDDEG